MNLNLDLIKMKKTKNHKQVFPTVQPINLKGKEKPKKIKKNKNLIQSKFHRVENQIFIWVKQFGLKLKLFLFGQQKLLKKLCRLVKLNINLNANTTIQPIWNCLIQILHAHKDLTD